MTSSSRQRIDRAAAAAALAPVAPPCFTTRNQWVEYVASAAVDQRDRHLPGPLVLEKGQLARFNPAFDICTDCTDSHSAVMKRQGRCRPRYLIELFAAKTTAKEHA